MTHDNITRERAYATEQFGNPGERWRRFLERVGTRSNDFAVRLSRARFVYLHRREVATHWLPAVNAISREAKERLSQAQAAEDDEAHSTFWHWFAIGVLLFCWIAEASMCAERGF